ncbi:SAC domain-containing protein [Favolaschia claudopus]|uniref:SAC domain-containing protein n=1 Tax=Favolaschia claudopus TaxID=2862362 RepID=A0AAW0EHT3_9AGAR
MRILHQRLHLYTQANDTYIFVPPDAVGAQSLTIHRSSGELVLNPPHSLPPSARRTGKILYGILGIISLSLSEYVIVMTGREFKGRLMGHDIYRATDFELLPLGQNINVYNAPHHVEAHMLNLVRSHLNSGNFLFSYTWDVTRRLQSQWDTRESDADRPFWATADDRFLQTRLTELTTGNASQDLSPYILPIMYGTFDIRTATLAARTMQICLISRRSRFRAGTRYFRRGIDHDGHVANFNETEQLLLIEDAQAGEFGTQMSFVQIRGSVPVFWAEVNTIRYKPDLQIMDLPDTSDMMRKHLQEQVAIYGDQALVNLVNRKGHEQPVKEAYERYISQLNLSNVRYQYFDFHNECKHMRWDRISLLIDELQTDLKRYGRYFHLASNQTVQLQQGTVRTNCMDNLDRTNVVQAALARWTLNEQLKAVGILSPEDSIENHEQISKDFREMWADHADAIANAYGGSGALKSDFTRTGKRTRKGLMEDGVKSLLRYFKNNFFDGARQDGFDLVAGNWVPRKTPSSSMFLITDPRPLITRSMPVVTSFSLFMICAGFTLPRTSDFSLFYFYAIWLTLLSLSLIFIVLHGIDYVSWPRLIPSTEYIYYTGPGFRSAHHGKGFGGDNLPKARSGTRMSGGIKRASPGAEEEKNPLANVDLSEEDAQKLAKAQRDQGRVELAMDRLGQSKVTPAYEKRRQVTKTIPKFWPVALMNHSHFAIFAQHNADQLALSYLEDVWIARDPTEHRCYTIEFYNAPPASADDKPDADGITEAMLDFSWERDVEPKAFKIDWKDADNALTKLYPGETGAEDDDDDIIVDAGSFFNFFEKAGDQSELGVTIANEVFPEAIEYFLGEAGGDADIDSDDEEDDDDEDAEEIDLEKPRAKKQKV